MGMVIINSTAELLKVMQICGIDKLTATVSTAPDRIENGQFSVGEWEYEFVVKNNNIWTDQPMNTAFWQKYEGEYQLTEESEKSITELYEILEGENKEYVGKFVAEVKELTDGSMPENDGDSKKIVELADEGKERLANVDPEEIEEIEEEETTYNNGDYITVKLKVEKEENGVLYFEAGELTISKLDITAENWEKGEITKVKEAENKMAQARVEVEEWLAKMPEEKQNSIKEFLNNYEL